MRRGYRRIGIGVLCIVLLAQLATLAAPLARGWISARLSAQVGLPVQIARSALHWSRHGPALVLYQLSSKDFSLAQAQLRLDWSSGVQGGPWWALGVDRAQISVVWDQHRRWQINGLPWGTRGATDLPTVRFDLQAAEIHLDLQPLDWRVRWRGAALSWRGSTDNGQFSLNLPASDVHSQAVQIQGGLADKALYLNAEVAGLKVQSLPGIRDSILQSLTGRVDAQIALKTQPNGLDLGATLQAEQLSFRTDKAAYALDQATATLRWQQSDEQDRLGWQAKLCTQSACFLDGPGTLQRQGTRLRVQQSAIDLQPLSPWLATMAPWPETLVSGQLRDLAFSAQQDQATGDWQLHDATAQWQNISVQTPTLNAQFNARSHYQKGLWQLLPKQAQVALSGAPPWQLRANSTLTYDPATEVVKSDLGFSQKSVHLDVQGLFNHPDSSGLAVQLKAPNSAALHLALPATWRQHKLAQWLETSLHCGPIAASFSLPGGPSQWALQTLNGQIDISTPRLHYHPDWPVLPMRQAQLLWRGSALTIAGLDADFAGARASRVRAVFADVRDPILAVDGRIDGDYVAFAEYLAQTPLAATVGAKLKPIQVQGRLQLDLSLGIDIGRNKVQVAGRVAPQQVRLYVPAAALEITNLSGAIDFDDRGFRAESLQFDYLGQSLSAQMTPDAKGLHFALAGEVQASQLLPSYVPTLANFVQGRSAVKARLFIANDAPSGSLTLSSDWRGTQISWPPPLQKTAAEAVPQQWQVTWGPGGWRAQWQQAAQQLELVSQGDVWHLTAHIDELDPNALWPRGAKSTTAIKEFYLSATVQRLRLAGRVIASVKIQGQMRSERLAIAFDAPGIKGQMTRASKASPLTLHFDYLQPAQWPSSEVPARQGPAMDLGALPAIDLRVDQLSLGTAVLRNVQLSGRPRDRDWVFDSTLALPGGHLAFQGVSRVHGDAVTTQMSLSGALQSVAQMLAAAGMPIGASGHGEVDAELAWSGMLWELTPRSLQGQVALNLRDGRIDELDPGLGRLLGLAALHTLPRRLALDFSDITDSGLVFDQIVGNLRIAAGVIDTERLLLQGPVGLIEVHGWTDFLHRKMNQDAVVLPRIGAALPLLGFVAGGPLPGAGAFVADTILKELGVNVDEIGRIEYKISGAWDAPEIRRTR